MEALWFCAFDHEIDLSAQCGAIGNFGVCCNNPLNERGISSFLFGSGWTRTF
jgi:hypothetical protein